ncbi:cystatin-13 [Gouania willdenowi]|uniref:cystatin-13 n=1 Tax=Gouania willdenowi TaxID=441366 RepID=UPI0010568C9D|nr:cystatin-13-like [Gouania willdenowi]
MTSFLFAVLISLSAVHLCEGEKHVDEPITAKKVVLQGDWAEINPYSKDVEAAVEYAVETFNSHSKRKRLFKLVSVIHPKAQTTNVMNYKFDTLLAKTKCLKSENQDAESCTFKKKHVKCHFVVTFDPRTNKHSLMKHKCSKHKEHS